jgi:hypothetical protein
MAFTEKSTKRLEHSIYRQAAKDIIKEMSPESRKLNQRYDMEDAQKISDHFTVKNTGQYSGDSAEEAVKRTFRSDEKDKDEYGR